jgi:hypothetical protein
MGKNSKSDAAKRAPRSIGVHDLFKLMSELISLRERVAQAELAAAHLRSFSNLPAAPDGPEASRVNVSRRLAASKPK